MLLDNSPDEEVEKTGLLSTSKQLMLSIGYCYFILLKHYILHHLLKTNVYIYVAIKKR